MLAALALTTTLAAASTSGAEMSHLGPQEAVRRALTQHPQVALADARVEGAAAELQVAAVPSPFVVSARHVDDGPFADEGESVDELMFSQELWGVGQKSSRREAAESAVAAARSSREWTVRQLAAETIVAHGRLASARARESTLKELIDLFERLGTIAHERLEAGEISEYEEQRVRVEVATTRAELLVLRSETARAWQRLAQLTGPLPEDVVLVDVPRPLPWSELAGLPLVDALADRPDVVAARERATRAQGLAKVARRDRGPRPTLSVGVESERARFSGDDFDGVPFPTDELRLSADDRFLVLELELAIPLAGKGAVAAALAEAHEAEADALLVQREAASTLGVLLAQGAELAAAHEALREASRLAADNLALLERAYEAGKLGLSDLLIERDHLLRATLQARDVEVSLLETEVQLAASAGALRLFGVDLATAPEAATR